MILGDLVTLQKIGTIKSDFFLEESTSIQSTCIDLLFFHYNGYRKMLLMKLHFPKILVAYFQVFKSITQPLVK